MRRDGVPRSSAIRHWSPGAIVLAGDTSATSTAKCVADRVPASVPPVMSAMNGFGSGEPAARSVRLIVKVKVVASAVNTWLPLILAASLPAIESRSSPASARTTNSVPSSVTAKRSPTTIAPVRTVAVIVLT